MKLEEKKLSTFTPSTAANWNEKKSWCQRLKTKNFRAERGLGKGLKVKWWNWSLEGSCDFTQESIANQWQS